MLTKEQKKLFQKDKYELVDMIIRLKRGIEIEDEPTVTINAPEDGIQKSLNKLKKEIGYGEKETIEENYQTYQEKDE